MKVKAQPALQRIAEDDREKQLKCNHFEKGIQCQTAYRVFVRRSTGKIERLCAKHGSKMLGISSLHLKKNTPGSKY